MDAISGIDMHRVTSRNTFRIYRIGNRVIWLLPGAPWHKSADGRTSPFPGQSHPTASVTGMPSAVKPLRTATRTWNSTN